MEIDTKDFGDIYHAAEEWIFCLDELGIGLNQRSHIKSLAVEANHFTLVTDGTGNITLDGQLAHSLNKAVIALGPELFDVAIRDAEKTEVKLRKVIISDLESLLKKMKEI